MSGAAGRSSDRKTLYVGGLAEEVTEAVLRAAFIPFGEVKELVLPLDPASTKTRGFAFIEFEEAEDCAHALENMNDAEFYGKVLRINYARPMALTKTTRTGALWENEEYLKKDVEKAASAEEGDAMDAEPTN